jgi:hypothetical protein
METTKRCPDCGGDCEDRARVAAERRYAEKTPTALDLALECMQMQTHNLCFSYQIGYMDVLTRLNPALAT